MGEDKFDITQTNEGCPLLEEEEENTQ